MENFEVLDRFANKVKETELGEIYNEKILLRYKNSDIKDPICLMKGIFKDIEFFKNFEVFEDDVFLAGFPRSGTTLAQELIWIVAHNFDFKSADSLNTYNRVYWFE